MKYYHSLLLFFALSLNCMENTNNIVPYQPKHAVQVLEIAKKDLPNLVSTTIHTNNEYKLLLDTQIAQSLKDPNLKTKVYLKNGEPVGFVTYQIYDPWYRKFFKSHLGPNAEIHHLAVAQSQRNKGYGKLLMQDVLEDCKKNGTNRISLWTTPSASFGTNLEQFYAKFGFNMVRQTKLFERQFALRLKTNPALTMAQLAFNWLKRKN